MPGQPEHGVCHLSSLQLMEHFRRYLQQSGLCSGIDNVKSMGWHVKRYPDLIQRLGEGKYVTYAIKLRVRLTMGGMRILSGQRQRRGGPLGHI